MKISGKLEGAWCCLDSMRDGIYDITSGSADAHLYDEFIAGRAGRPLEVVSLSLLSADAWLHRQGQQQR
jgi:hypothetical protein